MCTCASCKATDALAGWTYKGERRVPDYKHGGFDRWPRGDPAGPRASAAAYASHVTHGKAGLASGWAFKPGAAPSYPAWCQGAPGLPYPSKLVRDFIASGYKKTGQAEAQPARPAAPGKAPQHFPELDRQREAVHYSANDTEDEMAIRYMTVAQAADSWGIVQSRVRQWLADGRIKGAQKFGGIWLIPDNAERPKAAKPGELQAAARR